MESARDSIESAISAVEQTRFLSALAHRTLPFPAQAQRQVAEITQVEAGRGWSLHAKTGWQNAPGAGVGWWVGWVQQGDRITPFALNIAMAGAADAPRREQLGRRSLFDVMAAEADLKRRSAGNAAIAFGRADIGAEFDAPPSLAARVRITSGAPSACAKSCAERPMRVACF